MSMGFLIVARDKAERSNAVAAFQDAGRKGAVDQALPQNAHLCIDILKALHFLRYGN
jgi:hypothetical protein